MGHNEDNGVRVSSPSCPLCGGGVRQSGSGHRLHVDEPFVEPRRYKWVCDSCGAKFYSTERRPAGENACCQVSLGRFRGRQQSRFWIDEGNGILRRELGHVCEVCGEVYVWDETLLLRGG